MKQYTNKEQTAKIIELGFEPKQVPATCGWADDENYSIGELIELLPEKIYNEDDDVIAYLQITSRWEVFYTTCTGIFYYQMAAELIDALYMMVIKLKDKGLI